MIELHKNGKDWWVDGYVYSPQEFEAYLTNCASHDQRVLDEREAEIARLNELVREMANLLSYAEQTLTVMAALHHRPQDEYLLHMEEVSTRPEVRAILEKANG